MTKRADRSHAILDAADGLGHEARAAEGDHAALRLWLRMLAVTTEIEDEVRRRLRARFGITLARFDYMAQLHRAPDGLRMKELSRRLMVTGGNVTGLTDELEREGMVERGADPADRRASILRLTRRGTVAFEAMAAEHEGWILDLFGCLGSREIRQLHQQLGELRVQLATRDGRTREGRR
ncbi:MAG: MarR family winged helix-turn-helix transcriptional regulator [Alphaproteobacteria bacterium]